MVAMEIHVFVFPAAGIPFLPVLFPSQAGAAPFDRSWNQVFGLPKPGPLGR